jgi:hypothetical protein
VTTNPATTHVIQSIAKAQDLDCHVRTVEYDGVRLVELRDYIPSLDTYGRGYWMPLTETNVEALMHALSELASQEGF